MSEPLLVAEGLVKYFKARRGWLWGRDSLVSGIPGDATNLVAICSAGENILAMRTGGTLVRWGASGRLPSPFPCVGMAAGVAFMYCL